MRLRLFVVIALVFASGAAQAEKLYSYWTLESVGPLGELQVTADVPFLEQRLLPLRLVRLVEPAQISQSKRLAAEAYLFLVYQPDGNTAFCTIKDQSDSSAAKSLFIPMLDKRPCLIDKDRDGSFDSTFSVFDGYGSALTPSGNPSSAKPLIAPARYVNVSPAEFPVVRRLSYALTSLGDVQKRKLSVEYDNGRGFVPWVNESPLSPAAPTALNVRAEIVQVDGNQARIRVFMDSSKGIVGNSSGVFKIADPPSNIDNFISN